MICTASERRAREWRARWIAFYAFKPQFNIHWEKEVAMEQYIANGFHHPQSTFRQTRSACVNIEKYSGECNISIGTVFARIRILYEVRSGRGRGEESISGPIGSRNPAENSPEDSPPTNIALHPFSARRLQKYTLNFIGVYA